MYTEYISNALDELDSIRDAFNNTIIEFDFALRLGYIYVTLIQVRPKYWRKGIGTAAFNELFKWCDKYNYAVCLFTSDAFGVPRIKLHGWYKELGFTYNRGRKRPIQEYKMYEFVRMPNKR